MATADEGMIKRDWAAHAQLGGRAGRPENSKFLEADQFEKLRNYVNHFADPKRIVLMIQTAMYSGARFGEIGGLIWEDIDEKKNTIHIDKTFRYRFVDLDENGKWPAKREDVFGPTKTPSSVRDIEVSPVLIQSWH